MIWIYEVLRSIPILLTIIFVVDFLAACGIIFLDRKNPSAAIAWIMIIFMLPGVGLVFYVMLSQNISRQKIYRLNQSEADIIRKALKEQCREMDEGQYDFANETGTIWQDMIRMNQTYANAYYTQDNAVSVFTEGNEFIESLLRDIRLAEKSVNIQFFIVKNDYVGRTLIQALTKKAAEGIPVRFLMDATGSRGIWRRDLNEFVAAGGRYAFFFPPKLKIFNLKLNYRNHRKLAVIDGDIAYIGGYNIGREYLGKKRKFGNWRDTHLRLQGNAVQDINARFFMDWSVASREEMSIYDAYEPRVPHSGTTGMQIVSSGPDTKKEENKRVYMKIITSARRNIFIQSPYFVPDNSIMESLKMAAESGVDVRIMIPHMPDHMFVYWATLSYAGELIDSGVRIFVYDKGFLHAKTIVADSQVASVGSANFDLRSFRLNFETNAILYDSAAARQLEDIFREDEESSHEMTESSYAERGYMIKFKEAISRLLSDLL